MSNEYTPTGTYVPTTDDVETAFHQFASWLESTSPGEYAEAPEFADWQEAMHGFRRWLAKVKAKAQVEALREAAAETERKRSEPGLVHLDVRYQGYYTGIRSGMESAMRLLREAADRIAREAGIETGEAND